ncbi:nitroreductase family protein [Dyella acidisoli]|nr:nitroreductase family protein [Dyella acidisoli]
MNTSLAFASFSEPTVETWAAFQAINAQRRAVRHFDGGLVDDEDIRAVLAEAQLAPSSNNLQPYRLHWIKDPQLRGAVAAACQNQRAASSASALIVLVASTDYCAQTLDGLSEHIEHYTELSETSRAYHRKQIKTCRRFGYIGRLWLWAPLMALASWIAPVLTLLPLGAARTHQWAARGSLFAAQTLLLAATARGLDSCPMEGFNALKVARLLKLPRGAIIPLVIALGRRAPDARIEPRWRVRFDQAVVEH